MGGNSKGPPCTRQSLVTLAAFPPWGIWPGYRHTESRGSVYLIVGGLLHTAHVSGCAGRLMPIMLTVSSPSPLSLWRFEGRLRTYQAEVLRQLRPTGDDPVHVVAPPGSGKTLLGLLLAAREGRRTVVLTPTTTIRRQWFDTAQSLTSNPDDVSDDPGRLAELTVLTYQRVSTTGDGRPFDALARQAWLEELTQAGQSEVDAATWLAELAVDNPSAYGRGIRSRVRRARRSFVRQNPEHLAAVLHPNAVALIDALVAHGVETVVLDECHHLLDHWAIVVAYLAARLRAAGRSCLLVGLTATLPDPSHEAEFDNYSGLLGEVDMEVPVPAVVKEGHLAPYADRVWFCEPTEAEGAFIRRHEVLLHELVGQVLSSPDGVRFMTDQLDVPDDVVVPLSRDGAAALLGRIDAAVAGDAATVRACGAVLRALMPEHPVADLLTPAVFGQCTTDDLLLVLARFALGRLLPDPDARGQWEYVKRSLADFGYHLTDRGLRRGRDPIETTLATSAAKDLAAVDVLAQERASEDGDRVRAVVVTDFAVHGNHRGLAGHQAAGAVRTFETLASSTTTAGMRPVLLTSTEVRVRREDADFFCFELSDALGHGVTVASDDGIGVSCALTVPRGDSGRVVAAVSALMQRGDVHLIVGTRGLLGEGWDCPAANTLIDLTTVTTSTSTQQLRGRTLRLDPDWPEKVAHNWSVVCLLPVQVALNDDSEPQRLRRRYNHLWGLSSDDHTRIVNGLEQALPRTALNLLDQVQQKHPDASITALNTETRRSLPSRAHTRADWRIGEPYTLRERDTLLLRPRGRDDARALVDVVVNRPVSPADMWRNALWAAAAGIGVGGAASLFGDLAPSPAAWLTAASTVAGAGISLAITRGSARMIARRRRASPDTVLSSIGTLVAQSLYDAARVSAAVTVEVSRTADAADTSSFRFVLSGPPLDRALVATALTELFAPVTSPRFVLIVGRHHHTGPDTESAENRSQFLAVPALLGRRRADAERFATDWNDRIGPAALHEIRDLASLVLLREARQRRHFSHVDPTHAVWG